MRVLHLSTTDIGDGAARAAYRLHSGLQSQGVDSRMLVQQKKSSDNSVYGAEGQYGKLYSKIRRELDQFPLKRYRDREPEIFSPGWAPECRAKQIANHDVDLIHLHWICNGFMKLSSIEQFDHPIIWTLHDMWPFTGGCHYVKSCTNYQDRCGTCPHLGSNAEADLSRRVWHRKRDAWDDTPFTVVAPSQWLADCAADSSLFADATIKVIPNGLDTGRFRPRNTERTRQRLGLDPETKLVCFGANLQSNRKGADLLYEALNSFEMAGGNTEVVAFGNVDSDRAPAVDVPIHYLGFVEDAILYQLYSDVDVMVVPSRQEAFGQTASEAMAAGTPVVAFDATGLRDIVDHQVTGYLAEPFKTDDLARGIDWVLENEDRQKRLGEQARDIAIERFGKPVVAEQYREVYTELS